MDEWLIDQAKTGNKEALARLLQSNYEIVYRYLLKTTLNISITEDLVQETMIRAIEKISLYCPEKAKFSTWLISIAQNIYIDNMRRRSREHKNLLEEALSDDFRELIAGNDDEWLDVLDVLARMTEQNRLPIILKYYYGYSYDEIAKLMSIPLGTVKSRIHNGLDFMRREIDSYERGK